MAVLAVLTAVVSMTQATAGRPQSKHHCQLRLDKELQIALVHERRGVGVIHQPRCVTILLAAGKYVARHHLTHRGIVIAVNHRRHDGTTTVIVMDAVAVQAQIGEIVAMIGTGVMHVKRAESVTSVIMAVNMTGTEHGGRMMIAPRAATGAGAGAVTVVMAAVIHGMCLGKVQHESAEETKMTCVHGTVVGATAGDMIIERSSASFLCACASDGLEKVDVYETRL
ncbi:hypothetical protein VaNZ11_013631 [Volvox africanus]|uniref:Secreted protein n=1 Tax=Volvox africanus TaxID=51714 RepID=A0ABQ5SHI0_9CHLO|nr:hypothetical protein VaNZ11_013631 [Volvox africanus]